MLCHRYRKIETQLGSIFAYFRELVPAQNAVRGISPPGIICSDVITATLKVTS